MVWLTQAQTTKLKSWFIRSAPRILLVILVLIMGYVVGYNVKGDEITRDCKYAQAFRVGVDSFSCARRV